MRTSITAAIFGLIVCNAFSQSTVSPTIQLLTPDIIGDACTTRDSLLAYIRTFNNTYKSLLEKSAGDFELNCQVTFNPDMAPTYEFSGCPLPPDSLIARINDGLSHLESIRLDRGHYSFIYMAKVNQGCQSSKKVFEPKLKSPEDKSLETFKKTNLEDKPEALVAWLDQDVLPILEYYLTDVDKKFAGVRAVGRILETKAYTSKSTHELTDLNFDYWRASLEMEPWNMLIPYTKACLLAREGRHGYAERMLFFVSLFNGKGNLVEHLIKPLSSRLASITDELTKQIEKGIQLHDEQKYDNALSHYDTLLLDFPYSAWLHYEIYFSKSINQMDNVTSLWRSSRDLIYSCDPLYPHCASASTPDEGFELYQRMSLGSLLQSRESLISDLLAVADICLDIKEYGVAGQLYWLLLSHIEAKKIGRKNTLEYFLFAMEKLGHTALKQNFEGNHEKEFQKIEASRNKVKESNTMYKAIAP